jgi:uncharacterized protein
MNVTEKLFTPLSDDELDHLDNFLLDRVDDADDENRDEGILGVSELDGFLTAIASGPEEVGPSLWLPAVWGDCEPIWESESQLEEVFTLMLRHMNVIATHLMDEPDTFEPIFLNNTVEDEVFVVVDEWCSGYLRGLSLTAEQWREGGERMENLLQPLFAFGTDAGWDALEQLDEGEVEAFQQAIAPAVRAIHAFWLERRESDGTQGTAQPFRHSSAQIGRNDPCPCGSGKKYKNCCLH